MFIPEDLLVWGRRLGLTEATRSVIDHIRLTGPSRRVGAAARTSAAGIRAGRWGSPSSSKVIAVELAGITRWSTIATY